MIEVDSAAVCMIEVDSAAAAAQFQLINGQFN